MKPNSVGMMRIERVMSTETKLTDGASHTWQGRAPDEARVGLALARDRAAGAALYSRPGLVGGLVREALLSAGLGKQDPSAPLADIVAPGSSVLLKPNWVLHENLSGGTMDCMTTHPEFLVAVVREVAAAGAGRIVIGDAPLQTAVFSSMVPELLSARLRAAAAPSELDVVDFRNVVATAAAAKFAVRTQQRDASRFCLFDLGPVSLLELVSASNNFRVTSYDPDFMARVHAAGRHRYLMCREPFECDVIINLPKLKTHSKAGITAALKNSVGLNGEKSYLPHHRLGGSASGGDCYEGSSLLKRACEYVLDQANRRIGRSSYRPWAAASLLLGAAIKATGDGNIEGKWHGNDTVWRMSLDLNRALLYGTAEGVLSSTAQRRVYSLTDGIVAGEGEGPLAPTPINLGAVTFASNPAVADVVHAALMHLDWRRVPIVREAFAAMAHPVTTTRVDEVLVHLDGRSYGIEEVGQFGLDFVPAKGWRGAIENRSPGVRGRVGRGASSRS